MILVDSSVWIDWLNSEVTPQTARLERLSRTEALLIGDLVLAEVLQGCRTDRAFEQARLAFGAFLPLQIGNHEVATQAARHYRTLRALGVTVRKTIDTLIATRCILGGIALLYSDRDFDPFRDHLGLIDAMSRD
jgi:predicted nucleic acid-binding protein